MLEKIMRKRKIIGFTLLLFILLGIGQISYGAELELVPYNTAYEEWLQLPEEEREGTISPPMYVQTYTMENEHNFMTRMLGASISYNLKNDISLKVKNQQETEQCWAFAATTALETNVAKTSGKKVEYSPRHIEYATSKTFLDGTNTLGYNRTVNSGGNAYMAMGYITSGRGPVLESEMPFVNTASKINLSEIQGKNVELKLDQYIIFPNIYKTKVAGTIKYSDGNGTNYNTSEVTSIRNKIKDHIRNYGGIIAVTASTKTEYYSNYSAVNPVNYITSSAYNCDENVTIDHQITIVGWDDNYAVSNFNSSHRPTSPGAYIIQNSYGTEVEVEGQSYNVFDNGYLYVSYEDFNIETSLTGIVKTSDINYDYIYQHDPLRI